MVVEIDLPRQLTALLQQQMNLTVAALDTDLIGTGLLDSLALVDLLMLLEHEYGVQISLDELEVDNFRTVTSIAAFITRQRGEFSAAV